MPMGILWLVGGTVAGALIGWLVVDGLVVGGAAGFVITLAVLLVSTWLDGRAGTDDRRAADDEDISVSGR